MGLNMKPGNSCELFMEILALGLVTFCSTCDLASRLDVIANGLGFKINAFA